MGYARRDAEHKLQSSEHWEGTKSFIESTAVATECWVTCVNPPRSLDAIVRQETRCAIDDRRWISPADSLPDASTVEATIYWFGSKRCDFQIYQRQNQVQFVIYGVIVAREAKKLQANKRSAACDCSSSDKIVRYYEDQRRNCPKTAK